MQREYVKILMLCAVTLPSAVAAAQDAPSAAPTGDWPMGFVLLALIPLVLILATCFIKISVVLSFLRHALGAPQVPSTAIVLAISVMLTGFVMAPVATQMARAAEPLLETTPEPPKDVAALSKMAEDASLVLAPLERWLVRHSGAAEIDAFTALGQALAEEDPTLAPSRDSLRVILPAFVLTELREAFIIAFVILR